jgi:hypothetical protein
MEKLSKFITNKHKNGNFNVNTVKMSVMEIY